MPGKLSNGDIVRSFLELEDLLVDKLTLLVHDKVRVEGTFLASVIGPFGSAAYSWECDATETRVYRDVFSVAAISALDVEAGSFGGKCASTNDDAGNADKVGDVSRSQSANGGLRD